MISTIEDAEMQLFIRDFYELNKQKDLDFLTTMLTGLTNNDISFIS